MRPLGRPPLMLRRPSSLTQSLMLQLLGTMSSVLVVCCSLHYPSLLLLPPLAVVSAAADVTISASRRSYSSLTKSGICVRQHLVGASSFDCRLVAKVQVQVGDQLAAARRLKRNPAWNVLALHLKSTEGVSEGQQCSLGALPAQHV